MKFSRLFTFIFFILSSFTIQWIYAQFNDPTKTNLGDLLIRFCNDVGTWWDTNKITKSLQLETNTEEMQDICIYVQNSWPTDVKVKLNFVDGTITADESQKKACQPEETQENFWQYVIFDDNEKVFDVPAWSRVERHAQIEFPAGYAGMSYGCATLQIEGESLKETGDMFNILSRRGNFIDVLVHGEINAKMDILTQDDLPFLNKGNNSQFTVYQDPDTGNYLAKIVLENKWNVAQKVEVTPYVKTWFENFIGSMQEKKEIIQNEKGEDQINTIPYFGWSKEKIGKILTRKILPNNQVAIIIPLEWAIPFWQGDIKLSADITTTPVIDFWSEEDKKNASVAKTYTLNTAFFLVPWNIIIAVLILILLLWMIVLQKQKTKAKETKKKTKVKE